MISNLFLNFPHENKTKTQIIENPNENPVSNTNNKQNKQANW